MAVRLFVGNMPYRATEADLRAHFATVGDPSQVVIPVDRETGRPRGFAFVEYLDRAKAEEAVNRFNQQPFMGRSLSVSEARPREERPAGGFTPRPPGGGFAPRPGGFSGPGGGGGFRPAGPGGPGGFRPGGPPPPPGKNFGPPKNPDNAAVPVGVLGYFEGEALNFLAGRFYVKMLAFGLGEGTEAFLREVVLKVASGIKPPGGLPELVLSFPKDGLVARSEKFVKKNFMGYEFLRDGYVAAYRAGDKEIEGFFIVGRSEKEAEEIKGKLLAALAADGSVAEEVPLGTRVRNRYGQHLFIGRVGPVVCGAMRVPDGLEAAGQALLRALTVSLAERRSAK